MKDTFAKTEETYTSLSEARKEVVRRWNDEDLKVRVDIFFNGSFPEILQKEPRAMLTRQLTSPNFEFLYYYDLVKLVGIKPLCWEFLEDTFVTTSNFKACLAKMGFFHGLNRKLEPNLSYKKIIDLTGLNERKKLRDVTTFFGESLVDFHHELLRAKLGIEKIELFDGSSWYNSIGKNTAEEHYPFLLALAIRNGIIFENYEVEDERERIFTEKIFLPSFNKVERYFGLKPLIVKINSNEWVNDYYWWFYPEDIFKEIENKYKL